MFRHATQGAATRAESRVASEGLVPSGGRALTALERHPFEHAFAADFSQVRVHSGGAAEAAARSLDALAFTTGSNIVFGAGQLSPHTRAGQRLLAHELTHVIQQRGAPASQPAAFRLSGVNDAAEQEAERSAAAFIQGRPIPQPSAASADVARAPLPSQPSDFEIHRPGSAASLPDGAPPRVFFERNSDSVSAADPAIATTALPAIEDLTVIGYASADELTADPAIVQRRTDNVKAALVAAGHDAAHITTDQRPSPGRVDYRRVRSVEILRSGQSSVEPVLGAPATQACDVATETAFMDARTHAIDDFLDPVIAALAGPVPPGSTLESALRTFFLDPANGPTVATNLALIKAEVSVVTQPANHRCGTMNDSSCAAGAIAYNQPSSHSMTICPNYVPISGVISGERRDDHARNLIHEAAHSTAGLSGVQASSSGGTNDFGYRHQRMIRHLSLSRALANSDSYAMFVLTVQGSPIASARANTPPVDSAGAGLSLPADQAAFDRAEVPLARLQNWIVRAQQYIAQTHGETREILAQPAAPGDAWAGHFSDGATFSRQAGFDVRRPPARPAPDDDVKYAAINDRLTALARLLRESIEIRRETGPGVRMHFEPGPPIVLVVNPVFLANGPDVRVNLMLERLLEVVPAGEISPALRPAYAELVRRVRLADGL